MEKNATETYRMLQCPYEKSLETYLMILVYIYIYIYIIAQSAGVVEFSDCNSAESNECPVYDTKQSDGEVPAMLGLWGNMEDPFIAIASRFTLARSGSTR